VALPAVFDRLPGLQLAPGAEVRFGGWAFRGPLSLPVCWNFANGQNERRGFDPVGAAR